MAVEFEVIDKIFSIEKENGYTLQLNKMKWGKNPEKYDLRTWKDEKPMKGITLTEEDLAKLSEAISEFMGFDSE